MRIDPRHLIQFATIVEERSFTRAAQVLGLSQPALSKTVAYLESRLGQALLTSRRRPVEPSELGRVLAARGIQLRSIIDDAEQTADLVAQGQFGRLRVGAPPFFCEDLLSQIVLAMGQERQGIGFEMVSAYARDLRARVRERKLDVALVPMESMAANSGLRQTHLADVEHAIMARAGLALSPKARLQDVLSQGLWIGHSDKSILHGYAQTGLARMGVTQIRSFASSESGAGLVRVLAARDAFAILPTITTLPQLRTGLLQIVAIPPELPNVPIAVVSHQTTSDDSLIRAFEAFARREFTSLIAEARHYRPVYATDTRP